MEKFIVGTKIDGIQYNGDAKLYTTYEAFIMYKPDVNSLGEDWFILFKEAIRSLVLNTESVWNTGLLANKLDEIIRVSCIYARIYFSSSDSNRSLALLRSNIYDIVRGYKYNATGSNELALNLFEKIAALIKI